MKKQTKNSFRGVGRVSFLARKDGIQKMVDEGYPLKFIYEKHRNELNISYGQFTRYVGKYIRSSAHETERINPALPDRTVETSPDPKAKEVKKPVEKPARDQEDGKIFRDDAKERAANDEDLF